MSIFVDSIPWIAKEMPSIEI